MKTTVSNFIQKLKGISLSEQEQSAMRAQLLLYADMHTFPSTTVKAPVSIFSTRLFYSRAFVGGIFVLLLLVGTTGVTFAAQNTLPGQPLYAVKVNVTEPIQGALISSTAGKATWENTLAERRLTEAAELATQNNLATSTQVYLGQEVAVHVARSEQDSTDLEDSGNDTAALSVRSDLEARLAAHTTFLELLAPRLAAAGDATTSEEVATLVQSLTTAQVAVSTARNQAIAAYASHVSATSTDSSVTASSSEASRSAALAFVQAQNNSLRNEESSIITQSIPMLLAIKVGTTSSSTDIRIPPLASTTSMGTSTATSTATTTTSIPPETIEVEATTTPSSTANEADTTLNISHALPKLREKL